MSLNNSINYTPLPEALLQQCDLLNVRQIQKLGKLFQLCGQLLSWPQLCMNTWHYPPTTPMKLGHTDLGTPRLWLNSIPGEQKPIIVVDSVQKFVEYVKRWQGRTLELLLVMSSKSLHLLHVTVH